MKQDGVMVQERGKGGARPISATVATVMRRALGRRGFAEADIILRWGSIVGDHLAGRCAPERLALPRHNDHGATLHLRVTPGAAPEVQHLTPLIIERVNTYYGFRAVERLHLLQGPIQKLAKPAPPERRTLSSEERADIERHVTDTSDPQLRAALRSLGESLASRPMRRRDDDGTA